MAKPNYILWALLAVSLSACAQAPRSAHPHKAGGEPATGVAVSSLTPELVYQFLLSEIAGQRGELKLSAEAYSDLASRTRDPRVARRATEVSKYARQAGLALRNAELWRELEPQSLQAMQTVAALLAVSGRLQDARPHLAAWLEAGNPAQVFPQMHAMLARHSDKPGVARLIADLAARYPALPEAHYAVAQSVWQAGMTANAANALSALDESLRLRPEWETALLFKAEIVRRAQGPEAAMAVLAEYLSRYPSAREVTLAYAKQLAAQGKVDEARKVFTELTQAMPDNPEPHFALGVVAMQTQQLDIARTALARALELGYPEESVIRFSLAQIAEAKGEYEAAIAEYTAVSGRQRQEALLRAAILKAKTGQVGDARAWLRAMAQDTPVENEAARVNITQAEVQILRDAKQIDEAFAVMNAALAVYPDNLDLLYDRAMVAERLGKLDLVEQDLRRVIQLKPDYAHAYNALGYTLADRTTRFPEAIELLEKALNLAPNDPFILDSMGWALFKSGRLDDAVGYLRRAYVQRPDPDIAAHLGEALWRKGERDEAKRIWQSGLQSHPDNESLRETLSRLAP